MKERSLSLITRLLILVQSQTLSTGNHLLRNILNSSSAHSETNNFLASNLNKIITPKFQFKAVDI